MISASSGCLNIREALAEHTEDYWSLHECEEKYRREIEDLRVLRRYAASPSTQAVIYEHGAPGESVLRIKGPGDREVSLNIKNFSLVGLAVMKNILERAEAEGKLQAYL